ncbi:MAG: hypothetical protein ACR2H5_14695 [Ktedonobacteraceae bacterium]
MPMQPGKHNLPRRFRLPIFMLCIGMVALLLGIGIRNVYHQTPGVPPQPTPLSTSTDTTAIPATTASPSISTSVPITTGSVSPLLFGTNLSLYDNNDQVLQSASTRSQLELMHFRIIRMPVRPTLSNQTEMQAAQYIRNMGAYALVVLRGAVDKTVLADDTRIIQGMNRVFGRFVVFYEFGNEEDLLGVNVDNYTASWNAIVPQLKHIALNGQFIGPVNYQYDQNYLTTFLQHANPRPDEISWHEYTCDDAAPNDSCIAHIDQWTNHIADARSTMLTTIGTRLPIMITEWNYAPNAQSNDGKINDSNFMSTWTTKALQTLAANRIFASMQYTCTNSVYALVLNDGTPTIQGLTIRNLYQSMILSKQQPTPIATTAK